VTSELVRIARRGPVCTLTLDSPHNRNALSARLLDELAEGLAEAAGDPAVRVVVLTATGSVFCSGADLSEGAGVVASRLPEIMTSVRTARVPVVVRVNGHARAGGLGLIAVADLAVAAEGSTFAFSEVRVGVAPAMIMVPGLHVVDRRFLARATLTGETFGADAAASAGLLSAVVDVYKRQASMWLTSKPHRMARSIWARHSRRTSSRSAWSHTSSNVRGNPPSPPSNDGAWVIGPQRYSSYSALTVRWTPMSSPR